MSDGPVPGALPAEVRALLRERPTLSLATVSPTGGPHAASFFFAVVGPTLVCRAGRDSETARDVAANPAVAFTVDDDRPQPGTARGIQGRGGARIATDPAAIERADAAFREKFPGGEPPPEAGTVLLEATPAELWLVEAGGAAGTAYRRRLVYDAAGPASPEVAAADASAFDTVRVEAGADIVREGEPGDRFYIVVDGEVAVLRGEAGEGRRVETLRRGQFFGEIAILRGMPRTATVRAVTPATLLAMDRAALLDLVDRSHGTAADFRRVVGQRLAELGIEAAPLDEAEP